jgi:hypothetical protein
MLVFDRHWEGSGPVYHLKWRRRNWTLRLDKDQPGLVWSGGGRIGKLLSLQGMAASNRFSTDVFTTATLVELARSHERVEASYAPPNWGGVRVRAAWSPTTARDGVDLEVQITASSVGELQDVEVLVCSVWYETSTPTSTNLPAWVEPRDRRSAALTYDGRESASTLGVLCTRPVPTPSSSSLFPRVFQPSEGDRDTYYIEMVQPNDCARRIIREAIGEEAASTPWLSTQYGLLGHDLEKGIVLRARLRGLWVRTNQPELAARRCLEEFLRQPPPLGP